MGFAQNHSIGVSADPTVIVPLSTGISSHVDTGALAEIDEHLRVVGATPWTGMQGTGQITYGTDPTVFSATLSISGETRFRLDGQTSNGLMSIRIDGNQGQIQEKDGRQSILLPNTATSGIFQFEFPRVAHFPDPKASLLDHGTVTLDGTTLHRVTLEFPTSISPANKTKPETIATDLYFDTTSHLLVKSANSIRINGAGNNNFLRVIPYGDYRIVGGSMIPFRYTQVLNGQKQWTLQLSEVQLNPTFSDTFFDF